MRYSNGLVDGVSDLRGVLSAFRRRAMVILTTASLFASGK